MGQIKGLNIFVKIPNYTFHARYHNKQFRGSFMECYFFSSELFIINIKHSYLRAIAAILVIFLKYIIFAEFFFIYLTYFCYKSCFLK